MLIKDSSLEKIFLLVLGVSLLGISIINFFVYPSFKRMLVANTEAEAITIGQHLSRTIISDQSRPVTKLPPDTAEYITQAVLEFNLYKLKIFIPTGETIFSTDSEDIGTVNTYDYFQTVVARGKPFTKVVQKGSDSLEEQKVAVDVVETYVPIMYEGLFLGALEVYLDITDENRMLQNTLYACNIVSIVLTILFSLIILATLLHLNKNINERKKMNRDLQKTNSRLNQEIEQRKRIQHEKETLIVKLQSSLEEVKQLSGFLPICSSCKKIRDDSGYWNQIESYIKNHSEAEFSHGICPDCANELYPDFATGIQKSTRSKEDRQ